MSTKSYGKDFEGPLHIQRVATLPAWTSADVGRMVYADNPGQMYVGGASAWVTGGGGTSAGFFIYTRPVSAAATSWAVEHDLGQKYVQVQVIGTDDYQIEPLNVLHTDTNNLTIYFSVAVAGTAIIVGGAAGVGGTSGTSGQSGTSGSSGTSGIGTSGSSGTSGTSGYSETAVAVSIVVFDSATNCAISDGVEGFVIPYQLDGYSLVDVLGSVATSGSTNTMNIQIRRKRNGVNVDLLFDLVSIASGVYYARNGTIESGTMAVETGDLLYIDVDTIHGTPAKGLSVALTFSEQVLM